MTGFDVAAFAGSAAEGPWHEVVRVEDLVGFDTAFGPAGSPLRTALLDFFGNGGATALVVRTDDPVAAVAALDGVERFGLLVPLRDVAGDLAAWHELAVRRQAFLVVDADPGGVLPPGLGRNAAAYFPPLQDTDGVPRPCAPAVAGVYVRLDRTRGPWRSPAGRDAVVLGAGLSEELSPRRVEELTKAHVCTLRTASGQVLVWGARTASDDPEWKYVAVRRLLLFLERTLDEGLHWVVFEPNDEPLWARVRTDCEGVLLALWRQGAFPGTTPREAFFVRCDRTTMTQQDLDSGRLVVLVGVAPVKPAEFVIFRIGQWTADRTD